MQNSGLVEALLKLLNVLVITEAQACSFEVVPSTEGSVNV